MSNTNLHQIEIKIISANLNRFRRGIFDSHGNLYVICSCKTEKMTDVCQQTWNPVWNFKMSYVIELNSIIRFQIMNYHKYKLNQTLGAGVLNLKDQLILTDGNLESCPCLIPIVRNKKVVGHLSILLEGLKIDAETLTILKQQSSEVDVPFNNLSITSGSNNEELPAGWESHTDTANGQTYFFNPQQNSRSWIRPDNSMMDSLRQLQAHQETSITQHRKGLFRDIYALFQNKSSSATTTSHTGPSGTSVVNPTENISLQPSSSVSTDSSNNSVARISGLNQASKSLEDTNLPDGWEKRIDTRSNRAYYVNHNTKMTQWEDPRIEGMNINKKLPPNWEMRYTEKGLRFFVDHENQVVTLFDPRTGKQAGPMGSYGVPLPMERSFKWRLEHFQMDCRDMMPHGTLKLVFKRDDLLDSSYSQIINQSSNFLRKKLSVQFQDEEGLDYGGVAREWFLRLSHEILNPMYCLFEYANTYNYTLKINPGSFVNPSHLTYFKFIGRFIGMAFFHGRCIDNGFTRPFYKQILGKPFTLQDIESIDLEFYQSLRFIKENSINECDLELYYSASYEVLGEVRLHELIEGGNEKKVDDSNKHEYIRLMVNWWLTKGVEKQMEYFLEGLYDIMPLSQLKVFDERELELILCGIQQIDVDDWELHTVYKYYTSSSIQVQWFWKYVRSLDHEKQARLLQFVTGTCRLPLGGFSELQGGNGRQLFCLERIGDETWLPRSHTCFNRLDLPPYKSYRQLCEKLSLAFEETEGFGQE